MDYIEFHHRMEYKSMLALRLKHILVELKDDYNYIL